MTNQKNNNSISDVKRSLQFLMVIVLFFPTMISAIFGSADITRLNDSILSWGIVVIFCILIFLLTEIWGHRIRERIARQINLAIFIEIFFFILILYFLLAFKGATSMGLVNAILFEYFLVALYLFPTIIFLWTAYEISILYKAR